MPATTLQSPAHWCVPLPQLQVSAGAGGAMLTITLLRECELTLEPSRLVVLHDPVGLTGDRVLAHVYRAAAQQISDSATDALPAGSALQWLVVRPPLSRVWDDMDTLADRAWRLRTWYHGADGSRAAPPFSHSHDVTPNRTPRVAETPQPERVVPASQMVRSQESPPAIASAVHSGQPRVTSTVATSLSLLLISEAEQPSAVSSLAAARLLARALRRQWAVLATTREGPLRVPASATPVPPRLWASHLVCQGGVLRPVTPR